MICKNCGKEAPENSAFCNNCGAKIELEQKTSNDNKNTKNASKLTSIITVLIVFLIAALIGKYVIAPSFTDDNTSSDGGSKPNITSSNTVHGNKMAFFENEQDGIIFNFLINMLYGENDNGDDIVVTMHGSMLIDKDTAYSVIYDIEEFQQKIKDDKIENAEIEIKESDTHFTVSFGFENINQDSELAELAAEFAGVDTEDGQIYFDEAKDELETEGFVLKQTA